ncbi:PREDICTED: uncharacterized protein LOC101295734 [Fragaria vesca subsp. vesca]
MRRLCSRVGRLEKNFLVHERPNNLFVIVFDIIEDQNKVLRVGQWWYQQAPIVAQPYDGVKSLKNVQNIPLRYEIPETFHLLDQLQVVISRLCSSLFLVSGHGFYFDVDNAGVIVNPKGEMKGSAITGPIGKECADLSPRIASAANAICTLDEYGNSHVVFELTIVLSCRL